jgi:hypothetical protein
MTTKRIEIESCENCQFSYVSDDNDFICGLGKLSIEDVSDGAIHDDCPLRSGPVQLALAAENAAENDIANTRKCKDCGREFTMTYGELRFLKEKFSNNFVEPVRCVPCRKVKKSAVAQ